MSAKLWHPQEECGRWTINSVHRKFNQFGDQRSWSSDESEIRCWIEEHVPERLGPQAPGWAAQENGKETRLWPIEWWSICCSFVRSPTPSHTQPFQIKWEVYFSKNCVARLYYVVVMILHACICLWVCNTSPADLAYVGNLFIDIALRFTLTRSGCTC